MKKINHNNIYTFIDTYDEGGLNNLTFEEYLFIYIKYISSIKYMNNILKSILPYDKSLEIEDLVSELYERALNSHHKGNHKEYAYSLYSFKFDVFKLCSHYKSTKKGTSEKIPFQDELDNTNSKNEFSNIHEYISIKECINQEEMNILKLYFEEGYTYNEIGHMLNISHTWARKRIKSILKKIKDAL